MNENQNSNLYYADIYLRLSKEDGDKRESDSITNQREFILEFLKSKKEIQIYAIRVDEGYSGVTFDRPAFQEMLEDIRTGKVNCVVTKDLSRFGRNYIEVGKYMEKIFPYLGVRFIAINDNYDSIEKHIQVNNIMIPFKNLLNDAYCRDISIKIRSHLEVKRRRGDFVGAFAPYGYQKSESNKNKLEIDEEAAQVVRSIFRFYLQGSSAYKIAEKLNKENILTPMDYKKEKGSTFYTGFKKNLQGEWTHMHILRILRNPIYIGTLVQGKESTPNYKVKKKIRRDQSQWNQVENIHKAIISLTDFYNVQELLQMDTRTGTAKEQVYCLSGIVKCGDCGANMVRKTIPSGHRRFVYYVCGSHKGKKEICSSHSMNVQVLEESVWKLIDFQIRNMVEIEKILEKLEKNKLIQKEEQTKRAQQIREKKEEEIQNYNHLQMELYKDYKEGMITKEEYLELKKFYQKRIQAAKQLMEAQKVEDMFSAKMSEDRKEEFQKFKKYEQLESLSREMAVSLIEKILIYKKREGEQEARIEISFKYVDKFQISFGLNALPKEKRGDSLGKEEEKKYGKDE